MKRSDKSYFLPGKCVCCGEEIIKPCFPIDKFYASKVSGIDLTGVNVGVSICPQCGHESIQPVPQPAFLTAFYSNYMSKAKSGFYKERSADEIPAQFRARYGHWLEKIRGIKSGGKLIDVGSGLGMFLRLAKEYGFIVEGIEPNKEAAEACNSVYGIPVIKSRYEEADISNNADIVTMWDLLEHLSNPREALKKANILLNTRGIIVLEIPVRDSLLHNLAKILYRLSFGKIKRPLFLVCGIHHLNYFSEKDICKMLIECGFSSIETYRGETDLDALYRKPLGGKRIVNHMYNWTITILFYLARLLNKQNKLIIFAEKLDK